MASQIIIEICSNCSQHQWCTRHNESNYLSLAQELKKSIQSGVDNVDVLINKVGMKGGDKLGSFEVICKGIVLFSKLDLGYFPHIPLLTTRIVTFIDDVKNGKDLQKYKQPNSPIRRHPQLKKESSQSPPKRTVQSNLFLLPEKGQSHVKPSDSSANKKQKDLPKIQEKKPVVTKKEEEKKKKQKKPEEKKQSAPVQVKKEKVEDIPQKPVESSSKPPEEKAIEKQPEPEKKAEDPEPAKPPQNQQSSTAQPEEKKEEPKVETKEQPPVQKQPESKEEPKPDVETPPPAVQETKVPKEQEPVKVPQVAPEDPKATVNEAPIEQVAKEENTLNIKNEEAVPVQNI